MGKAMLKIGSIFLSVVLVLGACGQEDDTAFEFEDLGQQVPEFRADSAYRFVEEQVNFGPRNPGSEGHRQTKQYLLKKLNAYTETNSVFSQDFDIEGYDGETLPLTNIIAAFNPKSTSRIMLCAHWDTRPRADKDSTATEEPIPGADDGASGVGVLLELARLFEENAPPIGVDIILFDGEDYGRQGDMSNYFLGSRYWADNPPVNGYSPRFGILVDMVGGEGAEFPQEQYSLRYAPDLVNEVWNLAGEIGSHKFKDEGGNAISDDHLIVNQQTGIPTINIIRHTATGGGDGFAPYWHTHDDNMEIISRETLGQVGDVLTELIYNRVESRN